MMAMTKITRKQRLIATICISAAFFVAEIIAGLYTHSLSLVADAFHYLSDLVGFAVALVSLMISERSEPAPKEYTFGWQRATLLGAFFNGVFLLALAVSILVQAIERFTNSPHVDQPKIMFIIGCFGLGLNLLVMSFLHEHDHDGHGHVHGHSHSHGKHHDKAARSDEHDMLPVSTENQTHVEARKNLATSSHYEHKHAAVTPSNPGRDIGLLGVFVHVVGDAINNVGVIIAAVLIWKTDSPARYYADPAIGILIAIMIFLTAVPLTRRSGSILLQTVPDGINIEDVKHDIEMVSNCSAFHQPPSSPNTTPDDVINARLTVSNPYTSFTSGASISESRSHQHTLWLMTEPPRTLLKQQRSSWNVCTHTAFTPQRSSRKLPLRSQSKQDHPQITGNLQLFYKAESIGPLAN